MALIGWLDPDTVRDRWADASQMDDDELAWYLSAAYAQCIAFAPHCAADANAQLAQFLQTRALYRAASAGSNDSLGGDGLTVTVFPMDWTVKTLLRPHRIVGPM